MVCIIEDIWEKDVELEYDRTVGYLVYGVEVERSYACSAGINPGLNHRVVLVGEAAIDKLVRETLEQRLCLPINARTDYGINGLGDYSDLFCEFTYLLS